MSRQHSTPFWQSIGTIVHGWAVAEQGDPQAGIDEMRKGMAAYKQTGSLFIKAFQLGLLADGYGRLGNVERGLTLIAEALGAGRANR